MLFRSPVTSQKVNSLDLTVTNTTLSVPSPLSAHAAGVPDANDFIALFANHQTSTLKAEKEGSL